MPAYYANSVGGFLTDSPTSVSWELVQANEHTGFLQLEHSQTEVWRDSIEILRRSLGSIVGRLSEAAHWGLLLEFPIPRRQKRVDLILLGRDLIFVVEFKATKADASAYAQVEDYALDLANFHAASHHARIVPVVVAPSFISRVEARQDSESQVLLPQSCRPSEFDDLLVSIIESQSQPGAIQLAWQEFNAAPYYPIPTIIQAAISIFSGMEVREIAHAHSDPHNLTATVDALLSKIHEAVRGNKKVVCFVTGVPGSGKTLAGLRAVHDPRLRQLTGSAPAFFSGNGPLVKILREALIRDAVGRNEVRGEARRRIATMIQNVHVLARESYDDPEQKAPHERIIVFDEAQRAWNAERNRRKFKRDISEPEMILSIMDRHPGWACLICLVGGGQEIHDGEAGLAEWGKTLADKFSHWEIFASPEAVRGGPSVAGTRLFSSESVSTVHLAEESVLHLNVSTRSYRAQAVTEWSNALLKGNMDTALAALDGIQDFPVYVTRDFAAAKQWLRAKTRGTDRCGLVASSGAARLRAHGLETSTSFHRDYPYEHWFLNPVADVRSSYQLEVVATEFEIQGLELDWIGLCWGGNFLWDSDCDEWRSRSFVGTRWRGVRSDQDRMFITNSYRVLLTRARQGMVIWVPHGDSSDPTREPALFDATAQILRSAGLKTLRIMH